MELNDLFSLILNFFEENFQCSSAVIVLVNDENYPSSKKREIVIKSDRISTDEIANFKKYSEVKIPIYYFNKLVANLILTTLNPSLIEPNIKLIQGLIAPLVNTWQQNQQERKELLSENIRLQKELKDKFRPNNIIGSSEGIERVFELVSQVSQSDATVLLLGESGVGKELVASAIHYSSARANENFVKVNCAALTESLLESELFGHEKGSFTGATNLKKGRFELADNGTIFLDEIGDISSNVQIKLLRILQEKEFERVGGEKTIRVNVRIMAATNKNLEELTTKGLFREDLFYRLNVFPIKIPPLRERKSDIPNLVNFFVEKYSKEFNRPIKLVTSQALKLLVNYHWPGNIRELQNYIERAILLTKDAEINESHLPITLKGTPAIDPIFNDDSFYNWRKYLNQGKSLEEILEIWEKDILERTLKENRRNMSKTAKYLRLTNRKMGLRISYYKLKGEEL